MRIPMNMYTEDKYVLLFLDEDLESIGLYEIKLDSETDEPISISSTPVSVLSYDLEGLEHLGHRLLSLIDHARNRELTTVDQFAREKDIPVLEPEEDNFEYLNLLGRH